MTSNILLENPIRYFENDITRIKVSTSGVIYMGNHGSSFDYTNGANASIMSIAALRTDMLGEPPYGVRLTQEDGKVMFYLNSRHYEIPNSPSQSRYSKVWGEIDADATVKTYYEFANGYLNLIPRAPTVGLTGNLPSTATTFTRDRQLRSGLGIKFVQTCNGNPVARPTPIPTVLPTVIPTAIPTSIPTVIPTAIPTNVPSPSVRINRFEVRSVSRNKKISNNLLPNREAQIGIFGTGSGMVSINFMVDNVACKKEVKVNLVGGVSKLNRHILDSAKFLRNIQIVSGDVRHSARIASKSIASKTLKAKAFKNLCKALTR